MHLAKGGEALPHHLRVHGRGLQTLDFALQTAAILLDLPALHRQLLEPLIDEAVLPAHPSRCRLHEAGGFVIDPALAPNPPGHPGLQRGEIRRIAGTRMGCHAVHHLPAPAQDRSPGPSRPPPFPLKRRRPVASDSGSRDYGALSRRTLADAPFWSEYLRNPALPGGDRL
jgi:hypothetical protein